MHGDVATARMPLSDFSGDCRYRTRLPNFNAFYISDSHRLAFLLYFAQYTDIQNVVKRGDDTHAFCEFSISIPGSSADKQIASMLYESHDERCTAFSYSPKPQPVRLSPISRLIDFSCACTPITGSL
jgi:hypothetical protein